MMTVNLDTPVNLGCVFKAEDLKDTGLEFDYHFTILYAQGKRIAKDGLLGNIIKSSSNYIEFEKEYLKTENQLDVMDFFELSSFENDSDYVILKLKEGNPVFDFLTEVNKGVSEIYGITSDFKNYTPHITLAELNPGTSKTYLNSNNLKAILKDSTVQLEDFMISYGTDNEPEDRKQIFLTQNNCIDWHFRLKRIKKEYKELIEP